MFFHDLRGSAEPPLKVTLACLPKQASLGAPVQQDLEEAFRGSASVPANGFTKKVNQFNYSVHQCMRNSARHAEHQKVRP
jgi:hypothetical protein